MLSPVVSLGLAVAAAMNPCGELPGQVRNPTGAAPADTLESVDDGLSLSTSWVFEGAGYRQDHGVLQVLRAAIQSYPVWGFTARMEFMGKHGHGTVVPFPSSQGLSSMEAEDFHGLGEVWLQWAGWNGTRLKAGWVDANTEFAFSRVASAFANPSFGLTPTLAFLPSYPAPQPSLNAFLPAFGASEVGVGAFRRTNGDWSAVVQATGALSHAFSLRWQAGIATSGHIVEGREGHSDPSAFLILDWTPTPATGVFVQVARAGSMRHLAAGLTSRFPAPWNLRGGFGFSTVSTPMAEEGVAEIFLAARVTSWLMVQPDLQVRIAPGHGPATAGLLRVVVGR